MFLLCFSTILFLRFKNKGFFIINFVLCFSFITLYLLHNSYSIINVFSLCFNYASFKILFWDSEIWVSSLLFSAMQLFMFLFIFLLSFFWNISLGFKISVSMLVFFYIFLLLCLYRRKYSQINHDIVISHKYLSHLFHCFLSNKSILR